MSEEAGLTDANGEDLLADTASSPIKPETGNKKETTESKVKKQLELSSNVAAVEDIRGAPPPPPKYIAPWELKKLKSTTEVSSLSNGKAGCAARRNELHQLELSWSGQRCDS
jgi:hypothetical protein